MLSSTIAADHLSLCPTHMSFLTYSSPDHSLFSCVHRVSSSRPADVWRLRPTGSRSALERCRTLKKRQTCHMTAEFEGKTGLFDLGACR